MYIPRSFLFFYFLAAVRHRILYSLFQHQFLELGVAFLVLQEQVEFELSVTGTFGDTVGFEFLKRLPPPDGV